MLPLQLLASAGYKLATDRCTWVSVALADSGSRSSAWPGERTIGVAEDSEGNPCV